MHAAAAAAPPTTPSTPERHGPFRNFFHPPSMQQQQQPLMHLGRRSGEEKSMVGGRGSIKREIIRQRRQQLQRRAPRASHAPRHSNPPAVRQSGPTAFPPRAVALCPRRVFFLAPARRRSKTRTRGMQSPPLPRGARAEPFLPRGALHPTTREAEELVRQDSRASGGCTREGASTYSDSWVRRVVARLRAP